MTNEEAIQMLKNIQVALSVIYEGEPFEKCNDALNKAIGSLQTPNIFHEFVFKAVITEIPPNATNGDVIKIMFPNIDASVSGDGDVIDVYELGIYCQTFDSDWWNSQYRVESEDK